METRFVPDMHWRKSDGRPACDTPNTRGFDWPTTADKRAVTCCWCQASMNGAAALAPDSGHVTSTDAVD